MADIAELGFKTDTKGLTDADEKLDKVARQAKRTEKATDKMSAMMVKGFKAIGVAAAAYLTFKTIEKTMTMFIEKTTFAERSQAMLAAAIKSTGGVAGQSVTSLNAHASALQKISTYGDETTNRMQALLLTFTNIRGGVFERATTSVLDLATAMGQDLKSAAIQVGKALNDPILGVTALARSGIQFSEAQKIVIRELTETGRIAEAQSMVLAELEKQFGGIAQAVRGTLQGALQALGNSWGDLFELGKSTSDELRLAVEDLIVAIEDPVFKQYIENMGILIFRIMTGLISVATESQKLFNSVGMLVQDMFNGAIEQLNKFIGLLNKIPLIKIPKIEIEVEPANRFDFGANFTPDQITDNFNPNDFGGENRMKAAESYQKMIEKSQQYIAQQELERASVGLSSQAAAALRFEQDMLNEAKNSEIALTQTQRDEISMLAEKMAEAEFHATAQREGLARMNEALSPYEIMINEQTRLNELFAAGAISATAFGNASMMAAANMSNAYASAASAVSGALTQVFEKNKGVAIANALINTYQAFTAALTNPPGPPFSYAQAAAALASGFAQVQNIRSTQASGGGGSNAVSSSGGSAPAAAAQNRSISISGIDRASLYSGAGLTELIENLNDAVGNGAVLLSTQTVGRATQ